MLGQPPPCPKTDAPPGGWHPADGSRLPDPSARRGRIGMLFARGSGFFTRGRTYNVFRVLSVAPRLFRPFIAFNARLMPFGRLDRQDIERTILRTAWRTRAEYEWRQHCAIAQDVGVQPGEIVAIGRESLGDPLSPRSEALMRAVDELLAEHALSPETHAELRGFLDEAQVVEFCFLVGNYAMLAGALNTYSTPIEPALRDR